MAQIWTDTAARDRNELDAKKEELSKLQDRSRTLSAQIKEAFTEDGAITRSGLEIELLRLDVVRRGKNPLDAGEQCLIQGQQNEVASLLNMEATWLREKETLLEQINELEAATQTLIERVQRRSKKDA